jgi:hypothetical protein
MLALGNQGTVIIRSKILLQKSLLRWILTFNILLLLLMVRYQILRDPKLGQLLPFHSFLFLQYISFLNYDIGARSRLLSRGVTTIRTAWFTQLRLPNHTTYASLWPTYINLTIDLPRPERVQRHLRAQYSSTPALGHEGTRYSRHLSTPSARLDVLVIE